MTDASRMDKGYDSRDLDDRQRGGWCMPSEEALFPFLETPLPRIQMKRGGIRFPWFRVETAISVHKRWLRRTFWRVNVRHHDGERMMHHYMTFYSASDAANAEQIIKSTVQAVNEKYWREKDAR